MSSNRFPECLTSLYFDGMFSRRDQVSTALGNTYQWIWDHPNYKEWFSSEGTDKSSILWIKGKPGSGKSTLAKVIRRSLGSMSEGLPQASRLETYSESDTTNATASGPKSYDGSSIDVVADYFYSSRSAEKSRSPKWMLQALLYQILTQNPKLYEHFRKSFHVVRSTNQLWDYTNLKMTFLSLCRHINHQRVFVTPRFYIVIDAFDESENHENIDRTDFLDVIASLCSADYTNSRPACVLKVLLVSRPASDIESRLRAFKSIEIHEQTKLDIEEIVTSGLESIVHSLQGPSKRGNEAQNSGGYSDDEDSYQSSGLKELEATNITDLLFLVEYLLEHANGIILWVVLIMRELRGLFLGGFWTLGDIRDMVSSLPKDLEQCYEEMIRRIMKGAERDKETRQYGREHCVAKTQMMLSWATFAYRPLTIREFRDVIAMGDIQTRDLSLNNVNVDPASISSASLLSEHRLHNEKQVHSAVLYFCGGFLESVGSPRYSHTQSHQHYSKTDVLQLLHRSAKDFLIWNHRAAPFQLHAEPSASVISMLAIKYMQLSLPAHNLPIDPENWDAEDYRRFVDHLKGLPLLEYILFALPKHLRMSESQALKDNIAHYLSTLQIQPRSYSWQFLEDWAIRHTLLPDPCPTTSVTIRFRMRCIATAAELGKSQVVRLFMEAGVNDLSETLLAASKCGDVASVRFIFDHGQTEKLTTVKEAFFAGVKRGHLSIINAIISSGTVQPDVRIVRGASALHIASAEGHLRVLKYLITAGSDLEAEDEDGVRPLHIAALSGKLDAVKLLVSSGASLQEHTKMVSGYEHTSLTFAAMQGYLEIVSFIIEKYEQYDDMDITGSRSLGMIRDDGDHAMQLARSNRHDEVVQMIESALARAERRGFTVFKAEDIKVAAARASQAARQMAIGEQGTDKASEPVGPQQAKNEDQNKLIERLIGGSLSTRESIHLLSFAQDSDERKRGTQRFSRAFLHPDQKHETRP